MLSFHLLVLKYSFSMPISWPLHWHAVCFMKKTVDVRQLTCANLRMCVIMCGTESFVLYAGDTICACCINKIECQWIQTLIKSLSNLICYEQLLTFHSWGGRRGLGGNFINKGDYALTNWFQFCLGLKFNYCHWDVIKLHRC